MSEPSALTDDVPLHQVTLTLCDLCMGGKGGECHVPGCAMWMNRAPDMALWDRRSNDVEAEQERLAQAIEADIPDHHPPAWNREWASGMRSGMRRAAAIVRSGGTAGG